MGPELAADAAPRMAPEGELYAPVRAWIPVLLYMALIFWFSGRPAFVAQIPKEWHFYMMDKAGHAIEYALLGLLLYRALRSHARIAHPGVVAVVIAALYGATDELHQALLPFRSCELGDWLADCAGAMAAVLAGRPR